MLEDARWLRVQLGRDDELVERKQPAVQCTLVSLVVAAADFACFALPPAMHQPWAKLCQDLRTFAIQNVTIC
eukprot:3090703-Amphidinium_carterae.1